MHRFGGVEMDKEAGCKVGRNDGYGDKELQATQYNTYVMWCNN